MENTNKQKLTSSIFNKRTHAQFVCKFCHTHFVREDRYLAHRCKQMKRNDEFQSPLGQTAWSYYQIWLRKQHRNPPQPTAFLASRYFRTFVIFAEFAKKVNLPFPEKFIWLMVNKQYPPTIWTNDEVYTIYLEFVDSKVSPMEQVKISIDTLFSYAEKHEADISQVFSTILPTEVIHLVRCRRLSPWLLMFSTSFKRMFKDKFSPEQVIILEALIRPETWSKRFEENAADIETIKKLTTEMSI